MKKFKAILIIVAVSMFLGGPAMLSAADDDAYSGFLPDYTKLNPDPNYPGTKHWLNPEAKSGHYKAIFIDPVGVHLSAALIKDGARPESEVLNQVLEYFHDALAREFKNRNWNVADKPGDDVIRYRAAITGITAKGGLDKNPLHYVPAVFVVRTVSGSNTAKAHIYMESYYSDSVTGQLLGEVFQTATGESVSGSTITLDNLKGALDKWATKAAEISTRVFHQGQK